MSRNFKILLASKQIPAVRKMWEDAMMMEKKAPCTISGFPDEHDQFSSNQSWVEEGCPILQTASTDLVDSS